MKPFASAVCAALVLTLACENPARPGEDATGMLRTVSGDSQVTLPLGELPRPLVVRALDDSGRARPGVLVTWSSADGSVFVSDTSRTDASGLASNIWMLGNATGRYRATARADGHAPAEFTAGTSDSVQVEASPATLHFASLGDTATVLLRVRDLRTDHDTIIRPRSWSWYNSPLIARITVNGLVESAANGVTTMSAFYGRRPVPFAVIVRQQPVGLRIAAQSGTLPVGDTTLMGPGDTTRFVVTAVDARGHIVTDSAALTGVTWESSDTSIVSIDSAGTARSRSDGLATLRARKDTIDAITPLRVWSLSPVALAVDGTRSCALRADSTVACWGWREWVAGSAPATFSVVPESRAGWGKFISIATMSSSICGVRPGGQAVCWGDNQWGQLGVGSVVGNFGTPQNVMGGVMFASVSAGSNRNCGLTADGQAWCWGSGFFGGLGDSVWGSVPCTWSRCAPTPVPVAGGLPFTSLSVGGSHTCGLTADGRAWCWGFNNYGQLGVPRSGCENAPAGLTVPAGSHCRSVPTEVSGNLRFQSISAGQLHTCGVTTDGAVYCWGENHAGQLGVPSLPADFSPHDMPLQVNTSVLFRSVSATTQHTCAIDTDGGAWCWGLQTGGTLGHGAEPTSSCINGKCERSPVRVAGGHTFRSIQIGGSTSCGITTTGVAYCWGAGTYGTVGDGVAGHEPIPVRVRYQ